MKGRKERKKRNCSSKAYYSDYQDEGEDHQPCHNRDDEDEEHGGGGDGDGNAVVDGYYGDGGEEVVGDVDDDVETSHNSSSCQGQPQFL